jgi:HD-GYP domain-containing protein (c-di-GMP phosphodiesterase class II)
MTSDRPYRKALSEEEALSEIKRMSGIQFRPDFVAIFLDFMKEGRVHDAPLVVVKAA